MLDAERAFLAELGGGCNLPCGAYARPDEHGVILGAMLASLDGRVVLRATAGADDPVALGQKLAHTLLDEQGGRRLLDVA